jgi:hypothetical protein
LTPEYYCFLILNQILPSQKRGSRFGAERGQPGVPIYNWLSNRVFRGYNDIVAYCCDAWNELSDQPGKDQIDPRSTWAHGR